MKQQEQSPVVADNWRPSPRLLEANRRLYELRRAHQLQKQGRDAGRERPNWQELFAREQSLVEDGAQ